MSYQLDLFEPMPDEIDLLRSQIIDLVNMSHSVRKGVFRRTGEIEKRVIAIEEKQASLESRIARIEDQIDKKDKEHQTSPDVLSFVDNEYQFRVKWLPPIYSSISPAQDSKAPANQ